MRQLKLLVMAMMTTLSLCIAATSAQAVELKFLPEKATFSFKSKGETKLVTLSAKEVKCKNVTGTGEGVSERLGNVVFKFTECTGPLGVKCTGLSDGTEGNITVTGSYHLRHLLPASEGVNIAILVTSVHFSCFGVLFVVNGCVASMDILDKEGGESAVGKLLATMFVNFLEEHGEELPTSIDTDNGLAMENCVLTSKEGSSTAETAGQQGSGTIELCKLGGNMCTLLIDLTPTV